MVSRQSNARDDQNTPQNARDSIISYYPNAVRDLYHSEADRRWRDDQSRIRERLGAVSGIWHRTEWATAQARKSMLTKYTRLPALAIPAFLLSVALTGCGGAGCASARASGPATVSSGPVTIALDHSIYAPEGNIQVTVMNHSLVGVVVFWHITLNCLPLYISSQSGPAANSQGQYCYGTEADAGYWNQPLASGRFTGDTIGLGAQGLLHITLSPGTYQIAMPWAIVADHGVASSTGQAISQPFCICACATCSYLAVAHCTTTGAHEDDDAPGRRRVPGASFIG
jgi:hypothetical protein